MSETTTTIGIPSDTADSAMTDSAMTDGTEEYRLSPERTTVAFTTRHLFGLAAVRGTVRLLAGRVVVDRAASSLVLLEAELDMSSFASASAARDRVVATPKFLDSGAHPKAFYRSHSATHRGARWVVEGELTVKDVSARVELIVDDFDPATVQVGDTVRASGRIDRFAYGITVPTALAARHLDIVIQVQGDREGGL